MQSKREILQKALENINHPLSEITRRTTYRGHSPGVKPMTGIKLNLPKTSTMAAKMERVLADKSPEGKKRMKQMNNLVIGREEDGEKISLEFKTASSRERFRKMMNELSENVHLDESVKIMFKGFGKEVTEFQTKLKKFGFDKDYRKMMQNFIKRAKPGDGFYVTMSDKMIDFQIHPVADMMMGAKIKKLGDKDDLGEFGTRQLIAIKEDVQVNEERFKEPKKVNYKGGTALPSTMAKGRKPVVIAVPRGYIVQTYNKKRDIFSQEGPAYKTKAEAEKAAKLLEDVQLDEGSTIEFKFSNPMKAGDFMRRLMRDKLASDVDRYDGDRSPEEIVQVTMHPNDYERNDIERLAKRYKGQLRETNFRFPQPGEDYGEFGMSINDPDSFSGSGPSRSELKKRSAEIERKFASVMRKHKRTKVGEVLDLLDKDGGTKLYKDSDIKQINKYLTKFKGNVRKVAHEMLIIVMQGDDYLAKKRIPIREETEIVNFNFKNRSDAIAFGHQAKKQGLALRAKEFESQGNQTSHLAVDTSKLKTIGPKLKKLAKKYMGKYSTTGGGEEIDKMMREDVQLESLKMSLDERQKMTYVIDRSTKKVVHGPTDVADAKNYMKKQIQPRKFMIRDIRGAAKKVGDTV